MQSCEVKWAAIKKRCKKDLNCFLWAAEWWSNLEAESEDDHFYVPVVPKCVSTPPCSLALNLTNQLQSDKQAVPVQKLRPLLLFRLQPDTRRTCAFVTMG